MTTWKIESLNRQLTGDAAGGVTVAHWRAVKEETVVSGEDTVTHNVNEYGSVDFTPDPASEGYIQYADLTEADVVGWVKGQIDAAAVESRLTSAIEEKKQPTTGSGIPWEAAG